MTHSQQILSTVPRETWASTDPQTLAERLGLAPWVVYRYRSLHGLPACRKPGSGRPAKLDTSGFDPSKTNSWNARKLGCSAQYVARIRAKAVNNKETQDWC